MLFIDALFGKDVVTFLFWIEPYDAYFSVAIFALCGVYMNVDESTNFLWLFRNSTKQT